MWKAKTQIPTTEVAHKKTENYAKLWKMLKYVIW
jgi:hypothetical protein